MKNFRWHLVQEAKEGVLLTYFSTMKDVRSAMAGNSVAHSKGLRHRISGRAVRGGLDVKAT